MAARKRNTLALMDEKRNTKPAKRKKSPKRKKILQANSEIQEEDIIFQIEKQSTLTGVLRITSWILRLVNDRK